MLEESDGGNFFFNERSREGEEDDRDNDRFFFLSLDLSSRFLPREEFLSLETRFLESLLSQDDFLSLDRELSICDLDCLSLESRFLSLDNSAVLSLDLAALSLEDLIVLSLEDLVLDCLSFDIDLRAFLSRDLLISLVSSFLIDRRSGVLLLNFLESGVLERRDTKLLLWILNGLNRLRLSSWDFDLRLPDGDFLVRDNDLLFGLRDLERLFSDVSLFEDSLFFFACRSSLELKNNFY